VRRRRAVVPELSLEPRAHHLRRDVRDHARVDRPPTVGPAPGMTSVPPNDDAAIRNLFARYCLLLDLDDVDEWIALFTPDGTFDVYGHTFAGESGLRRMMSGAPRGL